MIIFRHTFFVLNLYCGHRRTGDIQWHIEFSVTSPSVEVIVLSVDIALDPIRGDLTREATILEWVEHIRCHRVINSGGGPPCETWSASRWHEGGPPPLRSMQNVWGIPNISRRQSEQVRVGSQLYYALVRLMAEHLRAGTSGWLEHPASPTWARGAPSSFDWKPMQAIWSAPCAARTDFDQCEHQDSDTW